MIKFHITKYFLARVFAFVTAIVGLLGIFLFETHPQLSYHFRIAFSIMFALMIFMPNKTRPKT